MKINSGSLAVGELIGAASFIAAVVAGSMAIVHPFRVGRKSFVRDVSFFIVAVLFGIGFLADGQIQMWECAVMVVFYIFYVCFVVVWHWMEKARRRQRRRERMMRDHYVAPEEEDFLVDEEDEDTGVGLETEGLLGGSVRDLGALERGEGDGDEDEEDEEEEEREAYADLSNAMRIARPRMERSLTPATPHSIRPSLVGALEVSFPPALDHQLSLTLNPLPVPRSPPPPRKNKKPTGQANPPPQVLRRSPPLRVQHGLLSPRISNRRQPQLAFSRPPDTRHPRQQAPRRVCWRCSTS